MESARKSKVGYFYDLNIFVVDLNSSTKRMIDEIQTLEKRLSQAEEEVEIRVKKDKLDEKLTSYATRKDLISLDNKFNDYTPLKQFINYQQEVNKK